MTHRLTRKILLFAVSLLIISALSLLAVRHAVNNTGVKTFRTDGGWGYSITKKDGKVMINQPFIPGIQGQQPFSTKRDAAKVGRMVKMKLRKGEIPSITPEELKKAGIITKGSH